jgi:hypothetical protein
MNYLRNKSYFVEMKPTLPRNLRIGLLIAGGILVFAAGFGLILLAIVAICYFIDKSKLKKIISDSELDQVCENMIRDLKTEALNKLSVDEDEVREANHIQVSNYDNSHKTPGVLYKQGKDGVWRSSQYEVALLFFSRDLVHCFVRKFSIIKDEHHDSIEEYFYRDIVSIKVTQDERNAQSEYIELTTSAGTAFKFAFRKSDAERVNRSINAMRNLLKSKKQGMA